MSSEQPDDRTQVIPFYVNGALSPEDRASIEAALPRDAGLRSELATAREIAAFVKRGGAEMAAKTAYAPDRLIALLARIRRPGGWWKAAFVAAAAVVAAQAGIILWQAAPGRYEALSGPAAVQEIRGQVLVRLSPEARWADVEALLSTQGMQIVGGPHVADLQVALRPGAPVDDAVQRLRTSPLVEFAGPLS